MQLHSNGINPGANAQSHEACPARLAIAISFVRPEARGRLFRTCLRPSRHSIPQTARYHGNEPHKTHNSEQLPGDLLCCQHLSAPHCDGRHGAVRDSIPSFCFGSDHGNDLNAMKLSGVLEAEEVDPRPVRCCANGKEPGSSPGRPRVQTLRSRSPPTPKGGALSLQLCNRRS